MLLSRRRFGLAGSWSARIGDAAGLSSADLATRPGALDRLAGRAALGGPGPFGWDGDHLRVFEANGEYYSDPFMNPEQTQDEFVTTRPEPEEPVPFDLDAVNRRLAALEGDE
jgi:hypothetical protein